ncbi:hypothetical protein RQP46_010328 [Phenoliferia psychrophenolica]
MLPPQWKRAFADGEEVNVKSDSSDTVYICKRSNDHFTCTCPAWRIQKGAAVDQRSCKHLRTLLGDPYEDARLILSGFVPSAAVPAPQKRSAAASASSSKVKKAKKSDDDEDDGAISDDSGPSGGRGGAKTKKTKVVSVLLAKKFELGGKVDPEGWWVSEKLDGIRAYWDGQGTLWSRLGNEFHAPAWFTKKLPRGHTLDGELFHSRNNFSAATSIVRSHNSDKWNEIRYKVFDIPSLAHLPFESRLAELAVLFPPPPPAPPAAAPSTSRSSYKWVKGPIVDLVEQTPCKSHAHLVELLKDVEALGGEGLMLRQPKSLYVDKRSGTLLKVKTFFDAEARVVGYEPGKGKYKDMTGSLVCEMESGKRFSCGSGLTDAQREKPPKIGAIISYRFQEITKDKVPRFPTFVGERIDVKGPKDADVESKGGKKKKNDDAEEEDED